MLRVAACWFALLLMCAAVSAQSLEIYSIDVEGGQATLIISPERESLLVDTGWGFDRRDADRIAATAKAAGLTRLDYLLVTHYHVDHVGGVAWLVKELPVTHFIDHGPTIETGIDGEQLYRAYQRASAGVPHTVAKPGDRIPIKGVEIDIVSSAGKVFAAPSSGAANPLCVGATAGESDKSENAQSIGFVLRSGKFRFLDLGDLTWDKEYGLVCPVNQIGNVDLYLTTHHGLDISNPAVLIRSLRPRVAITNNGAHKGGSGPVWQTLHDSPGLEGLWQLHYAVDAGPAHNASEKFIANPDEQCQGYGIKVVADRDGSFTVTNLRNGYSVRYGKGKFSEVPR